MKAKKIDQMIKLQIDADLLKNSKEYVDKQLEVMRKYNSAPMLTQKEYEQLILECAKYPQRIRNQKNKKQGH